MDPNTAPAFATCTRLTRPSSPVDGHVIFETDTGDVLSYSTPPGHTVPGWYKDWDSAWGEVAAGSITADTAFVSDETLTGLSVSYTQVAGRRYRTTVTARVSVDAPDAVLLRVRGALLSSPVQARHFVLLRAAGTAVGTTFTYDEAAASSRAVTRSVTIETSQVVPLGQVVASALQPARIVVEDVGPA